MDDDDYGLEYSDNESDESGSNTVLENQYYEAKGLKSSGNLAGAQQAYKDVLVKEKTLQKGEWGFKALKQLAKMAFQAGQYDEMLGYYKELLTYIKSDITKNHAEKSINSILNYVSAMNQPDRLLVFYQITLEVLVTARNDRLWFKTNTKLGRLYFEQREYGELEKILNQLKSSCLNEHGEEDHRKGTQLLEIYAFEIEMYTVLGNKRALQRLYEKAINIKGGLPHPSIIGTIRECGGKIHLRNGDFTKSNTDFFDAFKHYDECSSPRKMVCLKYLVVSSMLMKSKINPFDSAEIGSLSTTPEMAVMRRLVEAYQAGDIVLFERIIAENRDTVLNDPFILENLDDLVANVRVRVLTDTIKPYSRVRIDSLAAKLRITEDVLISLLVEVIQEGHINLKIDHFNGWLVKPEDEFANIDQDRYKAVDKMTDRLESLLLQMVHKIC